MLRTTDDDARSSWALLRRIAVSDATTGAQARQAGDESAGRPAERRGLRGGQDRGDKARFRARTSQPAGRGWGSERLASACPKGRLRAPDEPGQAGFDGPTPLFT